MIEANAGKSIREIFDQGGEPLFRQLETEALATVADAPPAVVSLGGGAILSEENRGIIAPNPASVSGWMPMPRRLPSESITIRRRPTDDRHSLRSANLRKYASY